MTWKHFERFWYITSLCIIIASLPFSKFGQSFGQFMMAGGWIVERFDYRKLRSYLALQSFSGKLLLFLPYTFYLGFEGIGKGFVQFYRNKPALIFSSILFLHLAGLIFTSDFGYAFKDLRTKLPILLLPLFFSTSEAFEKKGFHRFMLLFILAILVRSVYNAWLIQTNQYIDIRDVSRNISHIIFGLLLTMGIYSLLFYSIKKGLFPSWLRLLFIPVLLWFIFYLILSQSFTGFAISILTLMILIPILIFKTRKRWFKISMVILILLISTGFFFYFRAIINDYYKANPIDFTRLEQYTSRGNKYINNIYAPQTENGNYLWIYIQWDELRESWNTRSKIPFDSVDKKKQPIAYTVIRFLTSKGWRKDADAVEKLTPAEVEAIEKGVANAVFLEEFSIRGRVYEFLHGFENYRETGNPTGSTLMQRLEFWKASFGIIRGNWLYGVGTGDMNIAFQEQYEKMHSKLAPDQRWRSHNQFLSIFIGFGIFGLVWFLVAILYPPFLQRRYGDFFIIVFLIISFLSMMTEDTIESQTGVVFFTFFYSFFLFARKVTDPL
ncbi:MAG: O-antigen ligase family protein [Bacteroidales bacterium]|nr:O-antigen ligase family protein [Bacteroidales bacterium]